VYRLRNHHYVENSIQSKLVQKRQQAVERNRLYRARKKQQQVNNNNDEETVKKRQQAAERQRRHRAQKIQLKPAYINLVNLWQICEQITFKHKL
jgi:response regulator RpfG family c-di-GMP phosphodiesterase